MGSSLRRAEINFGGVNGVKTVQSHSRKTSPSGGMHYLWRRCLRSWELVLLPVPARPNAFFHLETTKSIPQSMTWHQKAFLIKEQLSRVRHVFTLEMTIVSSRKLLVCDARAFKESLVQLFSEEKGKSSTFPSDRSTGGKLSLQPRVSRPPTDE